MALANLWTPNILSAAAGGAILLAGAIDDFRSRKFHNKLFIACAVFGFAVSVALGGWIGAESGALGFLAGFALILPLVLAGAIGAGDMKLLAAFGAACGWIAVFEVGAFALVWGAIFGALQAILRGEGLQLFRNVARLAATRSSQGVKLHRIPFAAAIFVGWLTFLTYEGML